MDKVQCPDDIDFYGLTKTWTHVLQELMTQLGECRAVQKQTSAYCIRAAKNMHLYRHVFLSTVPGGIQGSIVKTVINIFMR